ncbi:hypothetical protein QBC34DRAFT_430242 [Podospora aff. communis PSN243]|uniref:Helix-turn-helix domain-containing protein n=1 Tax=Podospora aff. communis PSN243 TaxID=3040156 RepID=A0AAV9G9K7_9PEZI|nr:hypothetical protein QBC34DRAFT_430242 [Podospora aff. communis PSN243]
MGSSGSKAAQNTARKFPTRAPGSAPPPTASRTSRPPPAAKAHPQATQTKEEPIRRDASGPSSGFDSVNPAFADRLKQMGVAQPKPIFSPSSTVSGFPDAFPTAESFSKPQFPAAVGNATLNVLDARRRIQEQADRELDNLGRPGAQGREFLDVATVRKVLLMRQRGDSAAEIESTLKLKPGVVARLGPLGVVAPT